MNSNSNERTSIKDLLCDVPEELQEFLFEEFELATQETDDLKNELEQTKQELFLLKRKYNQRERDTKLIIRSLKNVIETNQKTFDHLRTIHRESECALESDRSNPPPLIRQSNIVEEYNMWAGEAMNDILPSHNILPPRRERQSERFLDTSQPIYPLHCTDMDGFLNVDNYYSDQVDKLCEFNDGYDKV